MIQRNSWCNQVVYVCVWGCGGLGERMKDVSCTTQCLWAGVWWGQGDRRTQHSSDRPATEQPPGKQITLPSMLCRNLHSQRICKRPRVWPSNRSVITQQQTLYRPRARWLLFILFDRWRLSGEPSTFLSFTTDGQVLHCGETQATPPSKWWGRQTLMDC